MTPASASPLVAADAGAYGFAHCHCGGRAFCDEVAEEVAAAAGAERTVLAAVLAAVAGAGVGVESGGCRSGGRNCLSAHAQVPSTPGMFQLARHPWLGPRGCMPPSAQARATLAPPLHRPSGCDVAVAVAVALAVGNAGGEH